ncbi:MAG: ATP-binding protein, partial [Marinobacter sp.]|nr:ATP-binding protein [Marinobacter sp.]
RQVVFPARFQVIAAMNPCPCGYRGHPSIECQCTPQQVMRYQAKLSGPLLDRFDLHVEVPVQPGELLLKREGQGECSERVRQRVEQARGRQLSRGAVNARLAGNRLQEVCSLDASGERMVTQAIERLGLSARALHRVLRVSRTVADLDGADTVSQGHLVEALGYRKLDRQPTSRGAVSV